MSPVLRERRWLDRTAKAILLTCIVKFSVVSTAHFYYYYYRLRISLILPTLQFIILQTTSREISGAMKNKICSHRINHVYIAI